MRLLRVTSADASMNKRYKYKPERVLRPGTGLFDDTSHGRRDQFRHAAGPAYARGFTLPAAGKTGTSRDGWFAGYTKDFLVIAWVGYDDNRDLNLEGARSALPIWTEFMIKATRLYPPRDPDQVSFEAPGGIDFVRIDSESFEARQRFLHEHIRRSIHLRNRANNLLHATRPENFAKPSRKSLLKPYERSGEGASEKSFGGVGGIFGGIFGGRRQDNRK